MADIGEFARQVAERYAQFQERAERWRLNLPQAAVEEFVKNAYYASQIADEGRWADVCLMAYPKGSELQFHWLFKDPKDPTAEEIAKLAHAVEAGSHICCICDNGQLKLGGIHVTMLNDRRDLGYGVPRVGNPLKVRIRGPGHIDVSSGGGALVYKAGAITEERLLQRSRVVVRLCELIKSELKDLTEGTVESLNQVFNDLAGAIARMGHGGMILIAETPKKYHFSSHRELVTSTLLQDILLRYWDATRELLNNAGGLANPLAERAPANEHTQAVTAATGMLENCIRAIANFSGMDGAIVMTLDCKVGAINAIIKRSETPDCRFEDERGVGLPRDKVIKNKGSRHQSALQYVMLVKGAFAFVISQDGSISAYHNTGEAIICERGMRALD